MRGKSWVAPSLLSLLLIVSLVWGYNEYRIRNSYEVELDNHYQRLFYDVKSHVDKVQTSLSKALLATTKERNILLFSEIMNEAASARDKMSQLPISHTDTLATEKFLTQASDYSYFLIQKHLEGQDITPDQREALKGIQQNTAAFNQELNTVSQTMSEDNFLVGMANAGRLSRKNGTDNSNALVTSLVNMDKEVAKAPELIYDGPFADQMINRKPVGLTGDNISLEEAYKIAEKFMGKGIVGIQPFEQGDGIDDTRIPSYSFQAEDSQYKNMIKYISVSKKGGKVLNFTNPRGVTEKNLTLEEGQAKALDFLEKNGFKNMEPNYHLRYDGTVLYNFVYTQDDITIYPDLVKVKIALDTGEIVGFDAAAYYLNHQDRNLNRGTLTAEEARAKIKTDFNIDSIRLALIPKGEKEVVCYEFKGKYQDNDFIVYINGETGQEEQILQIIKNENGTLTF